MKLENYVRIYCKRIGFKLVETSENDIINDAYILSHENGKDMKHNIKNIAWNYLRQYIALNYNISNLPASYEKKCSKCNEYKNHIEFKRKFDKKLNAYHLNYRCNTCEYQYQTSWHMNKYNSNIEYREKRLEYQRNYRLKIKKNDTQLH